MKKNFHTWYFWVIALFLSLAVVGCKDKEDPAPKPVANFNFTPDAPEAGQAVIFTNLSTDAETYEWTFGDGGTSTDRNPSHTYATAGSFTIKLVAKGKGGEAEVTKNITVTSSEPDPVADFTFAPQTDIKVGDQVTFTNRSSNAATYEWNFGDGGTSTSPSPRYRFTEQGTFTVTLTAKSPSGAKTSTKTATITVQGVTLVTLETVTVTGYDFDAMREWFGDEDGNPADISELNLSLLIYEAPLPERLTIADALWSPIANNTILVVPLTEGSLPASPFGLSSTNLGITAPRIDSNTALSFVFLHFDSDGQFGDAGGLYIADVIEEVDLSPFAQSQPSEVTLDALGVVAGIEVSLGLTW
ncbi:PKD domain-containing protein [Hugenholtzia roseola]|uniref:PKD domain-containing protein n=1 Tax=Hugenholtzia roseola TaxID=1002 RepID=UPI0003FCA604|nr:PKD domain-containing protein [Hugenholtzia roseola]